MREWKKEWNFKKIREAVDELEKDITELQATLETDIGKIQQIVGVRGVFDQLPINFEGYVNYSYGIRPHYSKIVDTAKKRIEEIWEQAKQTHDENIPKIETNKLIIKQVKRIMNQLGVQESRTEWGFKSPRSRNKTEMKVQAGYLGDLHYYVKTDDGFDYTKKKYEELKKKLAEYEKSEKIKEEYARKEKEQAAEIEKEQRERAALVIKYELAYDASWDSIMDHILSLNKYLRLAHFLCLNRGDWSDGPEYAKEGLESFIIGEESKELDESIYKEISGLIYDWDGDGRVFRDCDYNYTYLMSNLVEQNLLSDYHIAFNNTEGTF